MVGRICLVSNRYLDWRLVISVVGVLFMAAALSGCATLIPRGGGDPVTNEHWRSCEIYCATEGVKEACVGWRGNGCTCTGGRTVWFEQEFQDNE